MYVICIFMHLSARQVRPIFCKMQARTVKSASCGTIRAGGDGLIEVESASFYILQLLNFGDRCLNVRTSRESLTAKDFSRCLRRAGRLCQESLYSYYRDILSPFYCSICEDTPRATTMTLTSPLFRLNDYRWPSDKEYFIFEFLNSPLLSLVTFFDEPRHK